MHEASIALAILEEISERAAADRIRKVVRVHARIGVLSGIMPDALRFAWDVATEGTLADGSQLRIETITPVVRCKHCGGERPVRQATSPLPVCSVCGRSSDEIVRGRELLITAMEVLYEAPLGSDPSGHSAQERYAGS